MITLTKEWLLKTIAELEEERDAVPGAVNEDAAMSLAAMKIALASLEAEPVTPSDVAGPLAHAYKELTPTFMRNHIDVFERYGIYPDGSAGIQAMRIALDGMNRRAAMLQGDEPLTAAYKLPEETGSALQLRNLIRQRHAEWSQATFGDVGPVGPLKHLSKEALEAAAEPDDLSEWADMQFLLWDSQRRAGISDGEITAAMEEKLKVNMARQWPEPKDGEPRLHIKAAPQQEV